jgi:hypothetical protein
MHIFGHFSFVRYGTEISFIQWTQQITFCTFICRHKHRQLPRRYGCFQLINGGKCPEICISLRTRDNSSQVNIFTWKEGSVVSDYGLDDRGSIPTGAEDFSSSLCFQTGPGAQPASYPMCTGGPFPGGKARPGHDADHSPPSSAEVKYE